jgi:streptogrisin C
VVTAVVTALAIATVAAPAGANEDRERQLDRAPGGSAGDQLTAVWQRADAAGEAAVDAALRRDLGLAAAELNQLLGDVAGAEDLAADLADDLGAGYGGAWYDRDAGRLTVAVTGAAPARTALAAGARTQRVRYSYQRLESIKDELDALLKADPAALADAYSWRIDVKTNQVVVTVAAGAAGTVADLVADHGGAVRVAESTHAPALAQAELHGGTASNGCSVGFNLRGWSGVGNYFLTAGHCVTIGERVSQNGVDIGPVMDAYFPYYDDALVWVENSAAWAQGPTVWVYPGTVTMTGYTSFTTLLGLPTCSSGQATRLTCGEVTGVGETVNYPEGAVFNLTRHSACVEPGDSGGPNWDSVSTGNYVAGVTNGAELVGGKCKEKLGLENVSWYLPIHRSMPWYSEFWDVSVMTTTGRVRPRDEM